MKNSHIINNIGRRHLKQPALCGGAYSLRKARIEIFNNFSADRAPANPSSQRLKQAMLSLVDA